MISLKARMAKALYQEDISYKLEVLFPAREQEAEVTEVFLKEKTAHVNYFAVQLMNVSSLAGGVIAAHHAVLGAALLKLKEIVKKTDHKWVTWADENVNLKSRTREKAMLLAKWNVNPKFYVLGKERLLSVLENIRGNDHIKDVNEFLEELLGNVDLNNYQALEEAKETITAHIKKTQQLAEKALQSEDPDNSNPEHGDQVAPANADGQQDTDAQAASSQSFGPEHEKKAACKIIRLVPENANEIDAEVAFQDAAIQLIARAEKLISSGKTLTSVLPELISRIRQIADALEALAG